MSLHQLQSDQFFALDLWFMVFDGDYIALPRMNFLSQFKVVGFTIVLGAGHAAMLALICDSYRRSAKHRDIDRLYFGYTFVMVLLLIATHIEFWDNGEKANWGQYLILISAILLTFSFCKWLPPLAKAQTEQNAAQQSCEKVVSLVENQRIRVRIEDE